MLTSLTAACLVCFFRLSWLHLSESHRNPFVTRVENVPVQQLPFPAITLEGVKTRSSFKGEVGLGIFQRVEERFYRFRALPAVAVVLFVRASRHFL